MRVKISADFEKEIREIAGELESPPSVILNLILKRYLPDFKVWCSRPYSESPSVAPSKLIEADLPPFEL